MADKYFEVIDDLKNELKQVKQVQEEANQSYQKNLNKIVMQKFQQFKKEQENQYGKHRRKAQQKMRSVGMNWLRHARSLIKTEFSC